MLTSILQAGGIDAKKPRRGLLSAGGLAFRLLDGSRDLIVDQLDLQRQARILRIFQILRKQQIPLGGERFAFRAFIADHRFRHQAEPLQRLYALWTRVPRSFATVFLFGSLWFSFVFGISGSGPRAFFLNGIPGAVSVFAGGLLAVFWLFARLVFRFGAGGPDVL